MTDKDIEEIMNCSLTDEELDEGDASICDSDYQYDDILPKDDATISDRLKMKDSTLLLISVTLSLSTTSGLFESSCYFCRWKEPIEFQTVNSQLIKMQSLRNKSEAFQWNTSDLSMV